MMPCTFTVLNTGRLVLRPLRNDDAPALLALYGDPEVMRHWIHPPWTAPAQALAAIEEARRDLAAGLALHLAIADRANGRVLGSCALFDVVPAHRRASVGYLLARQHWGHGFGREALHAIVTHGAEALGLRRIEAEVAPDNGASQAVLAWLGFRREGRLHARWCVGGMARDVDLWAFTSGSQP